MITIIDPHIKKDDSYHVYKEAADNGYFIKSANGQDDYEGHCWPGASKYLDFLNPTVSDYWAKQFEFDKYAGSTPALFTWNDMNEPSVFSGPEITMHKDAKHHGGFEHRDVHNIYGILHVFFLRFSLDFLYCYSSKILINRQPLVTVFNRILGTCL